MRVVLDTNILIAALITKGTPPDLLYQAWLRGQFEIVTSTAQLAEIAAVLARPRLQKYFDADEAAAIVGNFDRSPFLPPVRARKVRTARSVLSGMTRFHRVIGLFSAHRHIGVYTPNVA